MRRAAGLESNKELRQGTATSSRSLALLVAQLRQDTATSSRSRVPGAPCYAAPLFAV
jgi:hypothetical protein